MRLVAIAIVLVAIGAGLTYYEFFRTLPPPYFASEEEHFLYGSIGTESTAGVPYWIWLVLPRIFPDKLPYAGGYESLGIVAQEGRELPIGFSKQTIGIERVGINCAFCHTATYRAACGRQAGGCARGSEPYHQPARLFAISVCLRGRSAIQLQHHHGGDREELFLYRCSTS